MLQDVVIKYIVDLIETGNTSGYFKKIQEKFSIPEMVLADFNDKHRIYEHVMAELCAEYSLSSLDKQIRFLKEKKIDVFLLRNLSLFYQNIGSRYLLDGVESYKDIIAVDDFFESDFRHTIKDPYLYQGLYDEYVNKHIINNADSDEFFALLNLVDKIFPEEKHIPNFLVFLFEKNEMCKKLFTEILLDFSKNVDHNKIPEDDIVKNFYDKEMRDTQDVSDIYKSSPTM